MLVNKKRDMTPFDMKKKPKNQNPFLLPIIWGGSYIMTRQFGLKIQKENMKGMKGPYLVIATHQGFSDYYIAPLALFPHRANYVSDMEGFAAFGEWVYRSIGCIGKRRYVPDVTVVKNMKYALSKNRIVVVYPESRHSNVGTTAYIPDNMGKLAKIMDVPVVILSAHGSYLANPFWDEETTRKTKMTAKLTCLYTREELRKSKAEDVQKKIEEALSYDEYAWQQENNIKITHKELAKGLHLPLYICPTCRSKYKMMSEGDQLKCESCGKQYRLMPDGYIEYSGKVDERIASNLTTDKAIIQIPDWYEWERDITIAEMNCNREFNVKVEALPNEKGFIQLGDAKLMMNKEAFLLQLNGEILRFPHEIRESVQTEYNYRNKGACIVLSTKDCCYYLYGTDEDFNPTELQFLGEELYQRRR